MSMPMQLSDNKNIAQSQIADPSASNDWQQLCRQVCVSCGAHSASFVLFTHDKSAPWLFNDSGWPLLPRWAGSDYQDIWLQASFYQAISQPNTELKSYLAVPIKRGKVTGLLLLHFLSAVPSLTVAQCQLLDTLAMHGALLWQVNQPTSVHRRQRSSRRLIKRLENLLSQVPTPISAFNGQGNCVFWNLSCEQLFGWSLAEITQHASPLSLLFPETEDLERVFAHFNNHTDSTFKEWQPYNKAGSRLSILCTSIKLLDDTILCIAHDITEQKEWLDRQRLTAHVFESSYNGIVVSDPEHRITHINPAFTRITGFSADEVIGRYPYAFKYLLSNTQFYQKLGEQLKVQDYWQGELNSQRKNGEDCALLLAITAVKDDVGQVLNHVAVLSDITHLKQHEANLKYQAFHDALTDIPNRLLFSDLLERAIASAERNNRQLAVCYLDLDGFKAVNDNFGHAAGDKLLVEISRRLKSSTRGGDAVARLGGDEFALLFTEFNSYPECDEILRRIQHVIRQSVQLYDGAVSISASIGVALYPQDADQAELLLRYADQAMYRAKKQGKNAYVFFDTL